MTHWYGGFLLGGGSPIRWHMTGLGDQSSRHPHRWAAHVHPNRTWPPSRPPLRRGRDHPQHSRTDASNPLPCFARSGSPRGAVSALALFVFVVGGFFVRSRAGVTRKGLGYATPATLVRNWPQEDAIERRRRQGAGPRRRRRRHPRRAIVRTGVRATHPIGNE